MTGRSPGKFAMTVLSRINAWARELKAQVLTLWFSRTHPDTPLAAKLIAAT